MDGTVSNPKNKFLPNTYSLSNVLIMLTYVNSVNKIHNFKFY